MAYDLVVGISNQVKDCPEIVGGIEFASYPVITALQKKHPIPMLGHLCNQFSDHTFDEDQLIKAKDQLFSIMVSGDLTEPESVLVYKLVAVTCYALERGMSLYGVAD